MSIPEFLSHFGAEAQCAEALKRSRWPDGFRCPRYAADGHYVVGHGARKLFQCMGCRHQTSLTAGTLIEHTKLLLTTSFLAIHLLSEAKTGLSALALKRDLCVSYPMAWLPHHKINHAVARLAAYLAAFAYRFNSRFDLCDLVLRLVVDVALTRPVPVPVPVPERAVRWGHAEGIF